MAHQGEVVVGEEIALALDDKLHLAARREGSNGERFGIIAGLTERIAEHPWPRLAEAPEEARLREWLLPAVWDRLSSGFHE